MDAYNSVLQYLYVGSKDALPLETSIPSFQFIVNCTVDIPFSKYPTEEQLRIPIEDNEDDNLKFLEMIFYTNACEKIHSCICRKKNVLVYCDSGNQRSCSLVVCFLIKYLKILPYQAINLVCNTRISAFNDGNRFINAMEYYYQLNNNKVKKNKVQKQKVQTKNVENQKIDENQKEERLGPRIQPI